MHELKCREGIRQIASGDGFLHGNVSMSLPGERVLMIGTGNVGLIVSYQLLRGGGEIIAE